MTTKTDTDWKEIALDLRGEAARFCLVQDPTTLTRAAELASWRAGERSASELRAVVAQLRGVLATQRNALWPLPDDGPVQALTAAIGLIERLAALETP